jgi:hypothetical protein
MKVLDKVLQHKGDKAGRVVVLRFFVKMDWDPNEDVNVVAMCKIRLQLVKLRVNYLRDNEDEDGDGEKCWQYWNDFTVNGLKGWESVKALDANGDSQKGTMVIRNMDGIMHALSWVT